MPHQCTKCGALFEDGAEELLKGCTCGHRFFFYIKKEKLAQHKEKLAKLTDEDKEQIEQDVFDILGIEEESQPVILDIEAVNIDSPGKYEVDLVKLMGDKPVVYKLGEGKYVIDLAESFQKLRKEK